MPAALSMLAGLALKDALGARIKPKHTMLARLPLADGLHLVPKNHIIVHNSLACHKILIGPPLGPPSPSPQRSNHRPFTTMSPAW